MELRLLRKKEDNLFSMSLKSSSPGYLLAKRCCYEFGTKTCNLYTFYKGDSQFTLKVPGEGVDQAYNNLYKAFLFRMYSHL